MIIYFTGTGNRGHIAKLLGGALFDTVIDAAGLIKSGEAPTFESDKPYVFVSPVYSWRMPLVFEDWLGKCSFRGEGTAYFVLTCGGDVGNAGKYAEKLSAQIGLEYKGTADVVMPDNYIIMFDSPAEDEIKATIRKADGRTKALAEKIRDGISFDRVKPSLVGRLCSGIVNYGFNNFYIGAKKFYATDACISCGKCAESCMLNNITLSDGRPAWGSNCTHCMACISKCPSAAIEYGKNTVGKKRYNCPDDFE